MTSGAIKNSKKERIENVIRVLKSKQFRKIVACCIQAACAGWNDACAGALLPYIERWFHLSYTEVSTLFVGAFFGFVLAGVLNNYLIDRIGMGKTITLGACMTAAGYAVIIAPPPFALFPVTYALLIGVGLALQLAQSVTYMSGLPNASIIMNYGQASYGFGAMLSPLCATAFVSKGVQFSYFFSVSLALAMANATSLFFAFWRDPEHGALQGRTFAVPLQSETASTERAVTVEDRDVTDVAVTEERMTTSERNTAMLKSKVVWLVGLFLFFYVGAEVSIGGWAVSFLLADRQGGKDVGYVATGFWAGIIIGRLTIPHLQNRFGERLIMYICIGLSILLEISIWTWRQLIGNAVAICLIGFFLATFFSIGISALTKLLPRHLHTGAIGLVTAMGQAGSASFPFLTGVLAQRFGPVALQPVVIVLLVNMAAVFFFIPSVTRRTE